VCYVAQTTVRAAEQLCIVESACTLPDTSKEASRRVEVAGGLVCVALLNNAANRPLRIAEMEPCLFSFL
jgi:hypothetical protein